MKRILPFAVPAILLFAACAHVQAGESFPKEWFIDDGKRPEEVVALEGKALPEVDLAKAQWPGDKAPTWKDLQGKIVVVDVWATWCPPCKKALPHNAEMAKAHADDGVAVLGLCVSDDAAEMKDLQEKAGVAYPAAYAGAIEKDIEKAWHTPWVPYYLVLDRKGVVRGAGFSPDGAWKAVDVLLKEQPARKE